MKKQLLFNEALDFFKNHKLTMEYALDREKEYMMDVPCMFATVMADFASRNQEAYGSIRDGVFYPNQNFTKPSASANVLVYISPNDNEWISVKDEVPKEKGYYLTCVDESVASKRMGVVEIQECYETVSGQKPVLKFQDYVTHWKPLPKSATQLK